MIVVSHTISRSRMSWGKRRRMRFLARRPLMSLGFSPFVSLAPSRVASFVSLARLVGRLVASCPLSWAARGGSSDDGGASLVCLVAWRGAWPHSSLAVARSSSRPPSRFVVSFSDVLRAWWCGVLARLVVVVSSRGEWLVVMSWRLAVFAHLVVSFSSVSWGVASCPSRGRFVACCRR